MIENRQEPMWHRLSVLLLLAGFRLWPANAQQNFEGSYVLVKRVKSDDGGYFAGAASRDLKLIAIGGYVSPQGPETANERNLTFFDADGNVLKKVSIGHQSWAVAMPPDGGRTVAGSDDEKIYVFEGTNLVAFGVATPGHGQIRGVAISDDVRFAGAGGIKFTIHDLNASKPVTPIYVDSTPIQNRAVDFAAGGRYVAYGGKSAEATLYMAVYDLQTRQRVFTDSITYTATTCGLDNSGNCNAELRQLSISSDGNRIVGGDWAGYFHYWVRSTPNGTWNRVQSIDLRHLQRMYWTDMDAAGTLAVQPIL